MEAPGLNKDVIAIERDAQGTTTRKVLGNIGSARIGATKVGEAKDSLAAFFAILSGPH